MKALVTGAGGFLGQYIVEQLLARGDQVRTLSRGRYPALEALGAETLRADIRDREAVIAACQGVEAVFHVAAIAGIWGPWEEFYGINTLGTQHVIAGCRAHDVRRLIFTSSPSVVFGGGDQAGIDERTPYPATYLCHYAHTKALAEQEVLAANNDPLRTCALRPHLIWGPRDTQLIPRLIARARSGQLRRVGDGRNLVDVVYVENAARAHLQAADALLEASSPVAGRAYFLSQGEPVNCWDWINRLLAIAGLAPVTRSISAGAAWRIGATFEWIYGALRLRGEPRMTRFLAAQLAKSHYYDISAARRDFGYEIEISTEEGLARTTPDLRRWAAG